MSNIASSPSSAVHSVPSSSSKDWERECVSKLRFCQLAATKEDRRTQDSSTHGSTSERGKPKIHISNGFFTLRFFPFSAVATTAGRVLRSRPINQQLAMPATTCSVNGESGDRREARSTSRLVHLRAVPVPCCSGVPFDLQRNADSFVLGSVRTAQLRLTRPTSTHSLTAYTTAPTATLEHQTTCRSTTIRRSIWR